MLIKKRKQLKKKMPTRRKTEQYWSEAQVQKRIDASSSATPDWLGSTAEPFTASPRRTNRTVNTGRAAAVCPPSRLCGR